MEPQIKYLITERFKGDEDTLEMAQGIYNLLLEINGGDKQRVGELTRGWESLQDVIDWLSQYGQTEDSDGS